MKEVKRDEHELGMSQNGVIKGRIAEASGVVNTDVAFPLVAPTLTSPLTYLLYLPAPNHAMHRSPSLHERFKKVLKSDLCSITLRF